MENALQAAPLIEKLLNYGVATMCTVALLLGVGWHFWKLKPALDAQNQLILNNPLATQALSECSKTTATILDKVSDKLIAHDERALNLMQQSAGFVTSLDYIKTNMATMDSTVRMHERMDKLPDKNDYALLHTTLHAKLDRIGDEVQEINQQVTKVSGKIGC